MLGYTLRSAFTRSGVGLHSGSSTTVRVLPGTPGEGRYFVRVDLPRLPKIPARGEYVSQTTLSTELSASGATVRTVEHLLAALVGMGVEDARIEIDGVEVPLLDGSAAEWVEAIAQAGLIPLSEAAPDVLASGVTVSQGDAFVTAIPAPEICFTYGIDFELSAIGNQWHSWIPGKAEFEKAIAPARTFGLAHQIEQLRAMGLIKGGSLDNALVCSEAGWLNPPLRFSNEPARHKLLDLVGDLSLLGKIPQAHYLAYKASHHLHVQLVQRILEQSQPNTAYVYTH